MTNALAGVIFSVSVPYMLNANVGNLGGKIGFVFAFLWVARHLWPVSDVRAVYVQP